MELLIKPPKLKSSAVNSGPSSLAKLLLLRGRACFSVCCPCGSSSISVPQFPFLQPREEGTSQFNFCVALYRDIMEMGSAPKPLHFCCWVEKGYTSSDWVAPVRRS